MMMVFLMAIISPVAVAIPPSPVFTTIVPFVISTTSAPVSVVGPSSNTNLGQKTGSARGTIVRIVAKDVLAEE
jgi:hypothetical protein